MAAAKLIISSIVGVSALGGASVGCYYCFKPKAPESSQTVSDKNNNAPSSDPKGPTDPVQREGSSVSDASNTVQSSQRSQDTPSGSSSSSDLTASTSPTTTSVGNVDSPQVGAGGVGA